MVENPTLNFLIDILLNKSLKYVQCRYYLVHYTDCVSVESDDDNTKQYMVCPLSSIMNSDDTVIYRDVHTLILSTITIDYGRHDENIWSR